ncbi:MAG: SDR family NAD(P)-dependent oxidoreductase [Candidatus Helarchaeota archaeon]
MGLLEGKVAIITAAAGAGIGQATARLMAKEGASVVVTDYHEKRTLKLAEDMSREFGENKILGVCVDVTSSKDVEEMKKQTLEKFGKIDILVNNAGRNIISPVEKMTDEQWDLVIKVNLTGTFLCTKAVVPSMIKQNWGRIISLASYVGFAGSSYGEAQYVATKAGIMGFTKALARELASNGINVNAIAPGVIPNPFLIRVYGSQIDEMIKDVPLGRGGRPEEIAGVAVFLASSLSDYITGETILVTGGKYMR